MREPTHPAAWLPPFAVGMAAAVAGEVAVGLLLYSTPGFLRALTLVLAVLLGSLALGLWTIPGETARVEGLRRRWLLALVAFAGAAAIAGAWTAQGGLAATRLDRGVGLAFLAGLPLYACGALLAAMAEPHSLAGPVPRVAPPAAAGAAAGALLTGLVLVSWLVPVSIYAFCLVLLSGGALLHARVLSAEAERKVLGRTPSRYGEVRVEERCWGSARRERVLLENGRVRGLEDSAGRPLRAWERALLEVFPELPPACLVVGGGAFTIPRKLLANARAGERRIEVVERNSAVVEAARQHFRAPLDDARLSLREEAPQRALSTGSHKLDLVVIDAAALAADDPVPPLDAGLLASLRRRLSEDGFLVLGGMAAGEAAGLPLERLVEEAASAFPRVVVYGSPGENGRAGSDLMLVLSSGGSLPLEGRGWRVLQEIRLPAPRAP